MRDPDTQPLTPPSAQPHVITYPRPWYRQVRFVAPLGMAVGLLLGMTIAAGSFDASASSASTPTVTRTVMTSGPTKTVKVAVTRAVTRTETPAAVKDVLKAWTDSGPEPGKQAAAMRRVMDEWPTLAKALEQATGVKAPAPIQTTGAPASPNEAQPPAGDVYYRNCAAARAAGVAPLLVGEPGYRPGLDRDGDGVACE